MREEIRALKRQRIIEEAASLFAERGYASTTLDDVAAQLKVSKQVIYSQFASKTELLAATFVWVVALCLEAAERAAQTPESPTCRLRQLIRDIVVIAAENKHYSAVFLREEKNVDPATLRKVRKMEERWHRNLEALLAEGVERGEFEVENLRLTALIIGGQVAWVYAARESAAEMDVGDVAEAVEQLVLKMVGARDTNATARRAVTRHG